MLQAKYISLSGENMANHIKSFFTSIIPHFEPGKQIFSKTGIQL